jgi:hypothetical protein
MVFGPTPLCELHGELGPVSFSINLPASALSAGREDGTLGPGRMKHPQEVPRVIVLEKVPSKAESNPNIFKPPDVVGDRPSTPSAHQR